jgi:hypothetical protein
MRYKPSFVKHLFAIGATILWIRVGLAPVMTHGSALLSGGSCFIGEVSIGRSWSSAVVGAVLVGLPAFMLSVVIDRGYVRSSLAIALSAVAVALGAIPFILCRFPAIAMPPESVANALLVILFAGAISFSVYLVVLLASQRFQDRGAHFQSSRGETAG